MKHILLALFLITSTAHGALTKPPATMMGTDVVTSTVSGSPKVFGLTQATLCTSNPCTPTVRLNTSVVPATYTRNATGDYVIAFTGMTQVICTSEMLALSSNSNKCHLAPSGAAASARVACWNSSTVATDEGFHLTCVGY